MNPYNVEFFTPSFQYRDSAQITEIGIEEDYLSLSISKIQIPFIKVEKRDFVRIESEAYSFFGIVKKSTWKKKKYEIEIKSLMSLFERSIHFNKELLKTQSVEEWLQNLIMQYFKSSEDELQNIPMEIITTSYTKSKMEFEENIENLYDIITNCLLKDDVVVNVEIDKKVEKLLVTIGKKSTEEMIIEADLPNVLEAELNFKETEDSINKLYIINGLEETQKSIYFLTKEGEIKKNPLKEERIEPVIFSTEFISYDTTKPKETTWEEEALKKAESKLVPSKYDNLIEITLLNEDKLVEPMKLPIGKEVNIIQDNTIYKTVLTGKVIKKGKCKLIFGAVRMELTKILNRRIKK